MSVITTRSSIVSILKARGSRSSSHRVRFKLPSNVRKILLDTKQGGDSRDYEDLVVTIRDSEISDEELLKLLDEAKNCISLLDYDLRLFVQALVILGWTHRSQEIVKAYQEFLIDLVSAHPQHIKVVIDQLVKLFFDTDEGQWVDGFPSDVEERKFSNNHVILKAIVRTIPMTQEILLTSIKHYFPYYRVSGFKQQAYIHNAFKVFDNLPHFRRDILFIICDRLLNLDVNCPREDILALSPEIFQMEDIAPVEALDFGMMSIFQIIDRTCKPSGELRLVETKSLFVDLMEVFEKSLLIVYGSHHVQFIIFYICSFKQTLVQTFLNTLWKKVLSPSLASVVRKVSVAYIASFLARANYVSTGFLKTYLSEMTSWCHRYIANQDASPADVMSKDHSIFHSVCQGIFYLIAFRHCDLVDSRKKLVFMQSLNLSKLVTCRLNPLRACSPAVVENFAAVAKDSQLAYCYTIIENNSRSFIQCAALEEFFPFDPYVLKKSSKFITPLYRKYSPELDADDDDDLDEGKFNPEKRRSIDEEDDFISENKRSEKPMDFSYSTSPGFKQMSV